MAKIVLDDLPSGFNRQRIDSNFTKIEDELQNKVLYRDNPAGEPNQMEVSIDLNGNDLLNVNLVDTKDLTINGDPDIVKGVINTAKDWATKTGDFVDGSDYSAKEWSIGTVVPSGSSKDWAITAEDVLVDGVEFSAKHYAAKTAADKSFIDSKISGASIVQATDSITGIVRFGTDAEQLAGVLDTVSSTPKGVSDFLSPIEGATKVGYDDTTSGSSNTTVQQQLDFMFGVGQTWQELLGSRSAGVTYTNTTGRTIMVSIKLTDTMSGNITLDVDGATVDQLNLTSTTNQAGYVVAVVPNNSTYQLNLVSGPALTFWKELR